MGIVKDRKCVVILLVCFIFFSNQSIYSEVISFQKEKVLKSFINLALENNLSLKQQELLLFREEIQLKKAKKEEFYPTINIYLKTSQGKQRNEMGN